MQEIKVKIWSDGTLMYLYDDNFFTATKSDFHHNIVRASHLYFNPKTQKWDVSTGELVLAKGFESREDAIRTERDMLELAL